MLGIALLLCLALLAIAPRGVIIHQDAQGKEQSIVERFELWKRALDVIEAKPWTGTGINTYNVAHEKYDKEQNWRVRGYYAHNGYLQLTAEIGLPGIFFFLFFLFMFFKRSLQTAHQVRGSPEEYIQLGFLIGLLAFLIYAAADNNLQSPPSLMFFWFLAGVLMARQSASRPEVTSSAPSV
jgi:O-antigen ligase